MSDKCPHCTQGYVQDAGFEPCHHCNYDNIEGASIPTKEERAANHLALQKLHRGNRFRLMLGMPMLPEKL